MQERLFFRGTVAEDWKLNSTFSVFCRSLGQVSRGQFLGARKSQPNVTRKTSGPRQAQRALTSPAGRLLSGVLMADDASRR